MPTQEKDITATAAASPADFTVIGPHDVMEDINGLRDRASKNHEQYVVGGRNAMREAMATLYEIFNRTMNASEQLEAAVKAMRAKLDENKVRANTKTAAIFVRYVFEDLDDKQVHVYANALEVAHAKAKEPKEFLQFVTENKGFEGLRVQSANAGVGSGPKQSVMGGDFVRGAEKLETIALPDAKEEFTVLFAVNNNNGTAELKDLHLSADRTQAVLALVAREVVERNKAPKAKKLTDNERVVRRQLKADLSYQEQLRDEAKFNLEKAKLADNLIEAEKQQKHLNIAEARVKGIKAAIKAMKSDD